jgi:hypothetical protein
MSEQLGTGDYDSLSDDRMRCEKCGAKRGRPYSFLVGHRRGATTQRDWAVGVKRVRYSVEGEITASICDACIERDRGRWRQWGVLAGGIASVAAMVVTLAVLASDPDSVPIVAVVAGAIALGIWGLVIGKVRGSTVELGEQMAIGLRSANLRRRGYDEFWTHAQWKDMAGT